MRAWLLSASVALSALATGCATSDDVRALRRPTLPPGQVALAQSDSRLYENVFIYEILGAPEFRLFDGGDVITTRPTRADVAHLVSHWLDNADLLAANIREADYLLTISFEELSGPNVVWFTDKHARASVRYTLVERRSGREVFSAVYDAHLQARMPGVTPEMVRASIASGLLGVAIAPTIRDSEDPVANAAGFGALLGVDSAAFASYHDTLLWDWPEVLQETLPRLGEGFVLGAAIGAIVADGDNIDSDVSARWQGGIGGALIGMRAAAPTGRPVENWDSVTTIGAFDGTQRRGQAVRGMLRQNFNRFLFGLDEAEWINIRDAVPCNDLNPYGYGVALITQTQDEVGYDCPIGRTRHLRPG